MKHEILQPVRHFNMHDDPLTNIETLHLVLWKKGLCIAGFDSNKNVLTTKIYNAVNWDISVMESVFINEPLVAGPQHITHIWVAEERNMIVPVHLFEPSAAKQWLQTLHFVEEGESVIHTQISNAVNAHIAFPLQNKLIDMLYKYFGEGVVGALPAALLCQSQPVTGDSLDITVLDHTYIFSIFQKGKLLAHQVSDHIGFNDFIYKIASICHDNGIAQDQLKVSFSGCCITEQFIAELKSFFPKMSVPGSEQFSSFTFLSKLIACA